MNPVRAGMVKQPSAYPWSSYACNAEGQADVLVEPHELYMALGDTDKERRDVYQGLFQTHFGEQDLADIRASWQTGTPLGNNRFREEIEAVLGKKVGYHKRGRPVKSDKEK
jgi:putative transposase